MKAVVFKGVGNIALEHVSDPIIQDPKDVIVKLTRSAICGTDLHFVRGTVPWMRGKHGFNRGTILGHEGVGVICQIGDSVKHFKVGDRVIVPSTICCGNCFYCDKKLYAQCQKANPHGPEYGTAFYGGPIPSGPFDGMQAEKVRVPFADSSLIKLPDDVSDDQAILLSDILPTAAMAVELADVQPGEKVAVFGCGPVGQLVIACLKKLKVKQIFAIDAIPSRLDRAQEQGAYAINFDKYDPVKVLKKLTDDNGPDRIIDAVGIDACQPHHGSLWRRIKNHFASKAFRDELKRVAPVTHPQCCHWIPGDGPSQVLQWAVDAVAKCGTISIIGVYSPLLVTFPIGTAMNKNLTIRTGNCHHKAYIPMLIEWVQKGEFDPLPFITHVLPFDDAIDAYKHFDRRDDGWIKVVFVFD